MVSEGPLDLDWMTETPQVMGGQVEYIEQGATRQLLALAESVDRRKKHAQSVESYDIRNNTGPHVSFNYKSLPCCTADLSDFESAELGEEDSDFLGDEKATPPRDTVGHSHSRFEDNNGLENGRNILESHAPEQLSPAPQRPVPKAQPPPGNKNQREVKFPRAPRSQRCGKCDHCLNPHWKKSCIVLRAQREAAGITGRETAQKQGSAAPKKSTAKPMVSTGAVRDASKQQFVERLKHIMNHDGGVAEGCMPHLKEMFARQTLDWTQRAALLTVLQQSASNQQRQFVQSAGLLVLQDLLQQAVQANRVKAIGRLLDTLNQLPITPKSLELPCTLALDVSSLRKYEIADVAAAESLRATAKKLRTKWKEMCEQAQNAERTHNSSDATNKDKPSGVTASTTDREQHMPPLSAMPAPTPSSLARQGSAQHSPRVSSLSDGDIFSAAERQAAQKSSQQQQQAKRPAPERPAAPPPKRAAAGPASSAASAGDAPSQKPPVIVTPGETPQTTNSRPSPLDVLMDRPQSSMMLGAFGSLVDHAALSRPLTAAERAKAAAARVPSPDPRPRTKKAKSVSWKGEDEGLAAVRYFNRNDPPAASKADAEEPRLTINAALETLDAPIAPPMFASAAKKEHLSEAEALRAHRQAETEERSQISTRLASLVPTVGWYDPPINLAAIDPALAIAAGEASVEAPAAAARHAHEPRAAYASAHAVPPSALEAPINASGYPVQPLGSIPRIPLSVEEAAAMHAYAAAAAASAQPPHQHQQQQQQQQYEAPFSHHDLPQPNGAMPQSVLGNALARLAASGMLPGSRQTSAAGLSSREPAVRGQKYDHRDPPAQKQHKATQPRPLLPPGMRPMLGLHRPAQAGGSDGQQHEQQQHPESHLHAPYSSGDRGAGSRMCRFFNKPGGCRMGDKCRFSHSPLDA